MNQSEQISNFQTEYDQIYTGMVSGLFQQLFSSTKNLESLLWWGRLMQGATTEGPEPDQG